MTDKPVTAVSERDRAREQEIANRYFPDEDGDKIAYTISHEPERRKCIKAMVAYRREGVRVALLAAAEIVHHLYDGPAISDRWSWGRIEGCHAAADYLRKCVAELEGADQS